MVKKNNFIETLCSYGVTILGLLIFGWLGIYSIFHTCVIDPAHYTAEQILFKDEDIVINLFLLAAFFVVIFGLRRYADVFKKVHVGFLIGGLAFYTVTLGCIWIYSVQSVPAADSGTAFEAAINFLAGDYTAMRTSNNDFYSNYSYFEIYPFQLGYVFISEIVYWLTDSYTAMPMQVLNVLSLAGMYAGLQLLSMRIFKSKAVTFILTFLLAGCIQGIFFTTFTYGNIPGFAASVWAWYFIVRFMQDERKGFKRYLMLIPCSLLMAVGLLAKYNSMIWLVSICIGLVIYVIRTKRWLDLTAIAVISAVALGSFALVRVHYENAGGVELGTGVGQWLYLDAGIKDSAMAPGWYNDISKSTYIQNDCDGEKAAEAAKASIKERLAYFRDNKKEAREFFKKKIVSQWLEPSYESVWVSKVKTHYYGEVDPDGFVASVYTGRWGDFFEDYFDFFSMIVIILAGAGFLGLIFRRLSAEGIIPLTALLGGFFYHLLFEAKSQYIMTYFILLIFFSAYGLYFIIKNRSFTPDTQGKKNLGARILSIAEKVEDYNRK